MKKTLPVLLLLCLALPGCWRSYYNDEGEATKRIDYADASKKLPTSNQGPPPGPAPVIPPPKSGSDPSAKPPSLGPITDRYAVVIGIDRCGNVKIPTLRYAESDARAVAEQLIVGGFPRRNVHLLLGEQATRSAIRSELGTHLRVSTKREDLVIIYFAGHGAPEKDSDGKTQNPDGFERYLVPYDANPDDLYASAIPMGSVEEYFERIPSERVIFLSDSCYSGALGGRGLNSETATAFRASTILSDHWDMMDLGSGRLIISSGKPSQPCMEDPEAGHGLFTEYLLRALRGEARVEDGYVTASGLYEYLESKVPSRSEALGSKQEPVLKGKLSGRIPLVRPTRGD